MSNFTITTEHQGTRLDKFLVEKLPQYSRSQIQKLIKSGRVIVNDKKTTVHYFLKTDDIISINPKQAAVPATETARPAKKTIRYKLELVAETPDFLVINKPAGLIVHEAPGNNEPTLVDLVLKKYPDVSKIGEDPLRPGIVHRLDKEVSGLMVIAKTQDMFDHLKSQFKTRKIKKEYTALVYGTPAKSEGEIEFNIDRSVTAKRMAAVPANEQRGRKAVTGFEVLKKFLNYSLLKIKPLTGRTHQIRVHLNAFGLPVVGDRIYKPKKLKIKIKTDRPFLQAVYLGFFDLNNDWQEYTLPLSPELQQIADTLRQG